MVRTDLLSIIRSLNTVFTANSICHAGYVTVCLLADRRSQKNVLGAIFQRALLFFKDPSFCPFVKSTISEVKSTISEVQY
jgi:hypothetical protein